MAPLQIFVCAFQAEEELEKEDQDKTGQNEVGQEPENLTEEVHATLIQRQATPFYWLDYVEKLPFAKKKKKKKMVGRH